MTTEENPIKVIELSPFEKWKQLREEMLSLYSEEYREKVELKIKIAIKKIFLKRKGQFFKYEDFLGIEEVKKHFPIMTVTGDRNIGKTTSAKRVARDVVAGGDRFALLRNINEEIKAQIKSDVETFLAPNQWTYDNEKTPTLYDKEGNIVGWYRDVNTIGKFKSIEFPQLKYILWEEFNTDVWVSNKFNKFVQYVTTAQRHRDDMQIIVQANFIDQNDEWLQMLGVGMESLEKEFVHLNWITGSITIFVPQGVYMSVKDKTKNLGFRLTLQNFELWKSQYGGVFKNEIPVNIVNADKISSFKEIFNVFHHESLNNEIGAYKMCMYECWDEEGKPFYALLKQFRPNDVPTFVLDYANKIKYPNAHLLPYANLTEIVVGWLNNKIFTSDIASHTRIVAMLALAMKKIEEDTKIIEEIEEL